MSETERKKLRVFEIKEGEGPEMWNVYRSFMPILDGHTPILKRPRPVDFLITEGETQEEVSVFITRIGVDIKDNEDSDSCFFILEGFTSAEYEKVDCVDRRVKIKYWPAHKKGEGESWKEGKEVALRWY